MQPITSLVKLETNLEPYFNISSLTSFRVDVCTLLEAFSWKEGHLSPTSSTRTSSPLTLRSISIRSSSPSFGISEYSESPVSLKSLKLPKAHFSLIDDSSSELAEQISSGELMNDQQAAYWYLTSPKISLPPRLGILKLLTAAYKIETPVGVKIIPIISEAEKKYAYQNYKCTGVRLIEACLYERKKVLASFVELSARALEESRAFTEYLTDQIERGQALESQQLEFLTYFETLSNLNRDSFGMLEGLSIKKDMTMLLARATEEKVHNFSIDFDKDLEELFSSKSYVILDCARKLKNAAKDLEDRITKLERDYASNKLSIMKQVRLNSLKKLIIHESNRLFKKPEHLVDVELEFLSLIFEELNQFRAMAKRKAVDPYDLEFIRNAPKTSTKTKSFVRDILQKVRQENNS